MPSVAVVIGALRVNWNTGQEYYSSEVRRNNMAVAKDAVHTLPLRAWVRYRVSTLEDGRYTEPITEEAMGSVLYP